MAAKKAKPSENGGQAEELAPGPYLRGDVVKNRHADPLCRGSQVEIEVGKINQDQQVRPDVSQQVLCRVHPCQDLRKTGEHLGDAHHGQTMGVHGHGHARGMHPPAAHAEEIEAAVAGTQGFRQFGPMHIAGSLPGEAQHMRALGFEIEPRWAEVYEAVVASAAAEAVELRDLGEADPGGVRRFDPSGCRLQVGDALELVHGVDRQDRDRGRLVHHQHVKGMGKQAGQHQARAFAA